MSSVQTDKQSSSMKSGVGFESDGATRMAEELQLLKTYLSTFQICKKCRSCFQNHSNVYRGTTPLCKNCRKKPGIPVVLIRYNVAEYCTDSPIPIITSQQFVILAESLSQDMLLSLNCLHRTVVKTTKVFDATCNIFRFVNAYENPLGSLFHETFPSDRIMKAYAPQTHTVVGNFEYSKEIRQ
jgi:hypothetical protein